MIKKSVPKEGCNSQNNNTGLESERTSVTKLFLNVEEMIICIR